MVMRKVTRAQLRTITMKLAKEQGGNCLLCGKPLDFSIKGAKGDSVVADHCHLSGRIRGALHRSCNGGEGRVSSAAGRWIVGSMQDPLKIAKALRALAEYLEREPSNYLYPTYKTDEEKRLAANAKVRKARATKKAAQEIKK